MRISYVLIILAFLTSCEKKLDIVQAQEKVNSYVYGNIPKYEYVILPKKYHLSHLYSGGFSKVCLHIEQIKAFESYSNKLETMVKNGFIELINDEWYDECDDIYTNVKLTDKGRKDLISEDENSYKIRLYENNVGNIESIEVLEKSLTSKVHYTINKINISEFGKMVNELESYGAKSIKPISINSSLLFTYSNKSWSILH